ncbi:hypothetical protein N7G274_006184 [Stereocaulon virgatum]|uniref:Putative lipoate-protein ligase A n=1 Tax=Stereocaulon virgatum TaxID=373712 RepID=A0ABR4A918_9LECA
MQAWRTLAEASKYQIYVSRSLDPFLNLSIEHFLLQKSPTHSTVLFLYVNRPCVVIGRNQNPWLEVNLPLLQQDRVQLVRRRSGGGTVFHDEGNVNYSVICPSADFTRDKHAKMVTAAIRGRNLRARVNERHDIVLDQGPMLEEKDWPDPTDMHQTKFQREDGKSPSLKISGSAYKITRQRALHHGTCLLASANLRRISDYLRSPARQFIKARGVESVRSPIGNVHHEPEISSMSYNMGFQAQVIETFMDMYGISERANPIVLEGDLREESILSSGNEWASGLVGQELEGITEIQDGVEEMRSSKWLFGQTPQFILSSHPVEEDDRERPPLPVDFPASARVYLKVRSSTITSTEISMSSDPEVARAEAEKFDKVLKGKDIQDISDFEATLGSAGHESLSDVSRIAGWFNIILGKG